MATCKSCGNGIEWVNNGGKWQPLEPGTGERHRCKIQRRCASCGEPFMGANYMKLCMPCYRNAQAAPHEAPRRGPAHPPRHTRRKAPAKPREPLQRDLDEFNDDIPF